MVNITEGHKVNRPIKYQKKCRYCGAIIKLDYAQMNFRGPTFALCPCGHNVQFTDDWGRCPDDVSFIYTKGNGR